MLVHSACLTDRDGGVDRWSLVYEKGVKKIQISNDTGVRSTVRPSKRGTSRESPERLRAEFDPTLPKM